MRDVHQMTREFFWGGIGGLLVFFLVLACAAKANTATSVTICDKPRMIQTTPIPGRAILTRVQGWVNGHSLHGWNEAPRTAGLGGYGIVAQISFTKRTGPATIRLASARPGCRNVRFLISWRLPTSRMNASR